MFIKKNMCAILIIYKYRKITLDLIIPFMFKLKFILLTIEEVGSSIWCYLDI